MLKHYHLQQQHRRPRRRTYFLSYLERVPIHHYSLAQLCLPPQGNPNYRMQHYHRRQSHRFVHCCFEQ
jgi:hypothetical protein